MLDPLFDVADLLLDLLDIRKSRYNKHISELRQEPWFKDLVSDYRYGYIISNNATIITYLQKTENLKLLNHSEDEKIKFIELVKREHELFTSFN